METKKGTALAISLGKDMSEADRELFIFLIWYLDVDFNDMKHIKRAFDMIALYRAARAKS